MTTRGSSCTCIINSMVKFLGGPNFGCCCKCSQFQTKQFTRLLHMYPNSMKHVDPPLILPKWHFYTKSCWKLCRYVITLSVTCNMTTCTCMHLKWQNICIIFLCLPCRVFNNKSTLDILHPFHDHLMIFLFYSYILLFWRLYIFSYYMYMYV